MSLKHNMARICVFVFAVLFSFTYCKAKPENCSEARCKLLAVGEGFASEFRLKASEKGVRLVYLNLKIGNNTYHPLDLENEFLPDRWVWANTISEPMLSLSYDYDILSLGLLTYQLRSMDVQLEDEPSGCLANLNSSCQDKVIGRALLNETEPDSGELIHDTNVVCVLAIEGMNFFLDFFEGNVRYHCCAKSKNERSSIDCGLVVKSSGWFKAFNGILNILTMVMMLFCPAFLLALPDVIFNLQEECRKQDRKEQSRHQRNQRANEAETPPDPRTSTYGKTLSRYGLINQGLAPNERDGESDTLYGGNESSQNQISLRILQDDNSSSSDEDIQPSENDSINQSKVYLDDASPITCSTLFDKYTKKLPDLIFFNVKLAFLWYCVIPFFSYIELGLNYTAKKTFFEELSRKQEANLAGPLFSFLFSKESILFIIVVPLPVIFYTNPTDFKLNGKCIACKGCDLLLGEELLKHLEKMLLQIHKFAFWLIKQHRKGLKNAAYCTHLFISFFEKIAEVSLIFSGYRRIGCSFENCPICLKWYSDRLFHVVNVTWYLICNVFVIAICGFLLGAICIFLFLTGLLFLCLFYSPYICLLIVLFRKGRDGFLWLKKRALPRLVESYFCLIFLSIFGLFLPFCYGIFIFDLLSVTCFIGALSCRFLVRMLGFIIIGLVLNAEVASPFVTFFVAASTNMYLCYYNLQKRYQEVKEMISQQWQKHKHLLHNKKLSENEDGTIPKDLFWYICGEKSKSMHKVLPIRREVNRMLCKMVAIFLFLFLALCAIIFLGNTYNISAVASTIAVFVTGVIPGLFFEGLTKAHRFSGATKSGMMKKIEKAVEEYIREINNKTIQSQEINATPPRKRSQSL